MFDVLLCYRLYTIHIDTKASVRVMEKPKNISKRKKCFKVVVTIILEREKKTFNDKMPNAYLSSDTMWCFFTIKKDAAMLTYATQCHTVCLKTQNTLLLIH